jgi:nucleotide-binding universal stress UspA family protein
MTVAIVVAVWIAIGLVIALVMIRKGHSPAIWLSLSPYGPLAGLLALSAADTERSAAPEVRSAGSPGAGPLDVLIGVDGSPQAAGAIDGVLRLFGPQLGRLCVATVVDYDVHQLPGKALPNERAAEILDEAAAAVTAAGGRAPTTVLLTGQPADALVDYAGSEGYTLVAAGRRGSGASKHIIGSAASRLSSHTGLPVILFGAADDTAA